MASLYFFLLPLLLSSFPSHSILQINPPKPNSRDDICFCRSWSFTVEANDAGSWELVPARCANFVREYFLGDQYSSDSSLVSDSALAFGRSVDVAGDGKDVWIFDIDETLLSNLPFYADYGFGTEPIDGVTANAWVDTAKCPGLPASLKLYKELQSLGFKIVLLTGRYEYQRNSTEKNLASAGFHDWEKLILLGSSDKGKTAIEYKSGKRKELEAEGYRIHGNSGDQWSDLLGSPTATRSFKLPNPLYYIP